LPELHPGEATSQSLRCGLPGMRGDVLPEAGGIKGARHAQRAAERPPPLREVEAADIAMHGGTTTRQPPTGIRDENALDRHDA
jgi:hypothetical protein